jgi:hypothetical protein
MGFERDNLTGVVVFGKDALCPRMDNPEFEEWQVPAQFFVVGPGPYAGDSVFDRYFGRFGNVERSNHGILSPTRLSSASNAAGKVNEIISLRLRSPLKAVDRMA